jgi:REP element-mobilizing transposase RayT
MEDMAKLPDERPTRKRSRLQMREYNQNGAYFITICTKECAELFGKVVDGEMVPSEVGQIVATEVVQIQNIYPTVVVDAFVLMPTHVHFLFLLLGAPDNPSVNRIVQQWKGATAKKAGFSPWQNSFHDTVLKTQRDYGIVKTYIQANPQRWDADKLNPKRPLAGLL